jgi:hypothetical protein
LKIRPWPKEIGADYLIARTGLEEERVAAEILCTTLGRLPLAHEEAAAYCERLDVSLGEHRKRFQSAPAGFLDDRRHAPVKYNGSMTVGKSFALAIQEVSELHPDAESLIVHASLLAQSRLLRSSFSRGSNNSVSR